MAAPKRTDRVLELGKFLRAKPQQKSAPPAPAKRVGSNPVFSKLV